MTGDICIECHKTDGEDAEPGKCERENGEVKGRHVYAF